MHVTQPDMDPAYLSRYAKTALHEMSSLRSAQLAEHRFATSTTIQNLIIPCGETEIRILKSFQGVFMS